MYQTLEQFCRSLYNIIGNDAVKTKHRQNAITNTMNKVHALTACLAHVCPPIQSIMRSPILRTLICEHYHVHVRDESTNTIHICCMKEAASLECLSRNLFS